MPAESYQHPSLFAGKFEDGLGVFVRAGEADIPADTVILRSPVLLSDSDANNDHAHRCMKLALAMRNVDAEERDSLYPREQEIGDDEEVRKPTVESAEKLMETEPKWEAEGVDFSTMEPEEKKKIVWYFEKAINNILHTPHGGFIFKGLAHHLNHSCMPNAVWNLDPEAGELMVKTVKSVEEGEEVTIGYFAIRDSKVGFNVVLFLGSGLPTFELTL